MGIYETHCGPQFEKLHEANEERIADLARINVTLDGLSQSSARTLRLLDGNGDGVLAMVRANETTLLQLREEMQRRAGFRDKAFAALAIAALIGAGTFVFQSAAKHWINEMRNPPVAAAKGTP